MMFDGLIPPTRPPGEVTLNVSPTCSTVVGCGDSQSRSTTPLTIASRSALGWITWI